MVKRTANDRAACVVRYVIAFLNSLFEHYDRLPASLRAEFPLKQIWILDEPDA